MCLGFRVWLQTSDYLVSGIVQLQGTIREYSKQCYKGFMV